MADVFTKEKRSEVMSLIRSGNTKPERLVRSALHRLGYRFRIASGRRIFGRPDVVLTRHRVVVFVHGCFWHRHRRCRLAYVPKSRVAFWNAKFAANCRRDRVVRRRLAREGWRVVVVWECEIRRMERLIEKLANIGEGFTAETRRARRRN